MPHDGFASFMQSVVLPRKAGCPNDVRLDGERTGGNRDVVGKFWHQGKLWKVHADTHYKPLQLALDTLLKGQNPFVEETTSLGTCLCLIPDVRAQQDDQYKHLYIYETQS